MKRPGRVRRIALIVDPPVDRLRARAMLADRYEIDEYGNGPDALSGMHAARPDLVLLDTALPGMDGSQVLRMLRRDPVLAPLPVIALAAQVLAGEADRYLAAGFDACVAMPTEDGQDLLDAIQRFLAPA